MTVQDVTLRVVTLAEKETFEAPEGSIVQFLSNVTGGTANATVALASPTTLTGGTGGGYILFFDGSYLPQPPPSPEAP